MLPVSHRLRKIVKLSNQCKHLWCVIDQPNIRIGPLFARNLSVVVPGAKMTASKRSHRLPRHWRVIRQIGFAFVVHHLPPETIRRLKNASPQVAIEYARPVVR
jgi:hypothetical protein